LKSIGHSVGQLFTVPAAVKDHERLYSSMYNRPGVFLFHDFRKKGWRNNDFWVWLYLPIILYRRAWARRQIDAAELFVKEGC
jgi:hypothetical protein